jgi:hypothetical protein
MATKKYLDYDGLLYFWEKLKAYFVPAVSGKSLTTNDFTDAYKTKLDGLENYTLPTASTTVLGGVKIDGTTIKITNGVISSVGGEATAVDWANINNKPTTIAGYGITDAYTKTEVDAKIASTYKAAGSSAFASLPTPSASILGYVYNVTDAFTTTSSFIEGAGNSYPAGTNVVVIANGTNYYYDVLAGFVDLSGYVQTSAYITNTEIDTIVAS